MPVTGFSVVKLATEKATGRQFACKIMALPPIGARASDHDSTRCVGHGRQLGL